MRRNLLQPEASVDRRLRVVAGRPNNRPPSPNWPTGRGFGAKRRVYRRFGPGVVIAQRDFAIAPNTGGFENVKLSPYGASLMTHNGVRNLLQVKVHITTTSGQDISQVMSLASLALALVP